MHLDAFSVRQAVHRRIEVIFNPEPPTQSEVMDETVNASQTGKLLPLFERHHPPDFVRLAKFLPAVP